MGVFGRKAEMGPRPGKGGEFQQARGHCPSPFPLAVLVSPKLARNKKKGKISAGERISQKLLASRFLRILSGKISSRTGLCFGLEVVLVSGTEEEA